ncbi:hypothetical protein B0H14DRAFT_3134679, partial [Mycena olivaceomarginata]
MNHDAWAASWKTRTAVASSGPLRDVKRALRIVGCPMMLLISWKGPLSIPKFCQCHAPRGLSNLPSMKQRPRPLGRRDKGKNFGDFQSNVEIFGRPNNPFGETHHCVGDHLRKSLEAHE